MSGLLAINLIVRRSLRQHAVSTAITATSIAMGCGLLMTVIAIDTQARNAFTASDGGFDAVIGPRGSKLQLVLNSLFHLEQSTGTLSYQRFDAIRRQRVVKRAYPIAVGDTYNGYRVVGAPPELFTEHEIREGQTIELEEGGRVFKPTLDVIDKSAATPRNEKPDEKPDDNGGKDGDLGADGDSDDATPGAAENAKEEVGEAVIGSFVAQQTDLKVGSTFSTNHGVVGVGAKHDLRFKVVGVMKPTNTPMDRVVWVPLEGYFRMPGHVLRGSGRTYRPKVGVPIPDKHKEYSAVLIKLRAKTAGMIMSYQINHETKDLTMVFPIAVTVSDLFNKVAWVQRVLALVAAMVVAVAAMSILTSIYNAMNERRREFAILRALGAGRPTVFSAIVLEAGAIATIGAAFSFAVYAGLMAVAAAVVREQTGVVLETARYHMVLWIAPLASIGIGMLSGIAPAVKAYRTDVANNLTPIA